jgi:hypothetical protein
MISIVAAVVCGLIFGLKIPFTAPLLLFLSTRKNFLVLGMFAYFLILGYEAQGLDLFSLTSVVASSFLLFIEGLRGRFLFHSMPIYILIALVICGLFIKQLFLIGVIFSIVYLMWEDKPSKGLVVIICFICVLVLVFKFSPMPLVVALAGGLCAIIFWGNVKRLSMVQH